jgi:hypothetical protein
MALAAFANGLTESQRDKYLAQYNELLPKWLAKTQASGMWREQAAALAKAASGGAKKDAFFQVPDLLSNLAVMKLAEGVVDVISGQLGGWNKIATAARYQHIWLRAGLAAMKLSGQANQTGPWSLVEYHRFVQGAFIALITDERSAWEPMMQLVQMLDRNGSARASSRDAAFPEFARSLSAAWIASRAPESPQRAEDPLAQLLVTWADPVENARAFERALDYHLWRGDERSSARNPDERYSQPGILLCPAHLIAYLSLRKQLGMVSLAVEHPMAGLPTFHPPENVKPADDPVLDTIEQTLRGLG